MTKKVDLTWARAWESLWGSMGASSVWAILAALFIWFGGYEVLKDDVKDNTEDIDMLKLEIAAIDVSHDADDARLDQLSTQLASIAATVEQIDKRLERMERQGN